jgi:general secretion pathway protein G
MKRARRNTGFTLVELMLVVVIIGILAGVVLPKLAGKTKIAKINATKQQVRIFETSVDMYELEVGKLPDSLKDLVVDPGESNWNGPYLSKRALPKDPWGNAYVYNKEGSRGITYDVYSVGEDGIDGTDDDIGNWGEEDET